MIKKTPLWEAPGSIVLYGELRFPGRYPIHRGETLSSVLRRAGGFTDLAFVEGAVFTRDELKQREKEQLDLLTNRLQKDLAAMLGKIEQSLGLVQTSSEADAKEAY